MDCWQGYCYSNIQLAISKYGVSVYKCITCTGICALMLEEHKIERYLLMLVAKPFE